MEQMAAITELLTVLNQWEKTHGAEIMLAQPIAVSYGQDPEALPYGHLVDEIGGTWAFRPATKEDTQ